MLKRSSYSEQIKVKPFKSTIKITILFYPVKLWEGGERERKFRFLDIITKILSE